MDERGGVRCPLAEVDRARIEALDRVQMFELWEERQAPLRHAPDPQELGGPINKRELAQAREVAVHLGDVLPLPAHEGEGLEHGGERLNEVTHRGAVLVAELA